MICRFSASLADRLSFSKACWRGLFAGVAVATLAICSGCKPKAGSPSASSADAAPGEGRHKLVGTIVTVNSERSSLLVDHEAIPGFMAAMTMEFKVGAGDLANARPGQRIRGVLFQAADGFHLEEIWPVGTEPDRIVAEAERSLRQDTVTRGTGVYREVGEHLPDFALYDQTGAVVQAARFRGRQLMVNFIFTRCPDPLMCPAATARMIGVQRRARDAGVTNLDLVSITLDPEYDTPGVLRDYAQVRGIDTSNFSFLTGPERAIKDLLAQLGVMAFRDGPLITHTLTTVLIDESGKIIHRADGSQWDAADFVARMRRSTAPSAAGSL